MSQNKISMIGVKSILILYNEEHKYFLNFNRLNMSDEDQNYFYYRRI